MIPAGCVSACPGCKYRGFTEEESHSKKMNWVKANLDFPILPIIGPVKRWHYRKKALLHARYTKKWEFGFIKRKGREEEFIAIPDCPIHEPYFSEIIKYLSEFLPQKLPLAFLLIQGRALTFVLKSHKNPDLENSIPQKISGIDSIWINWNPSAGRRVLSSKHWSHISGSKWLGEDLKYGPCGFQQVSELNLSALDFASHFLSSAGETKIVDLYSGLGISLRRWKEFGWQALGVELGGESCEAAKINSGGNILVGRAEERIPQLQEFIGTESFVAYTNPPRDGHHKAVIEFLQKSKRVAYLSCNVKSLARDIADLRFDVKCIQPYDFFPQTDHVEVLALLERS